MLTVLAWIVFFLSTLFNFLILLVLMEIQSINKRDWYTIVLALLAWMASTTYLFGFF